MKESRGDKKIFNINGEAEPALMPCLVYHCIPHDKIFQVALPDEMLDPLGT